MSNFNDIQAVWKTARADNLPGTEEIMKRIKKYRLMQVMKRLLMIVFTLVLLAVMIRVVLFYNSTMLSTRLGEALLILAILFLIITNARELNRVAMQKDRSNRELNRVAAQRDRSNEDFINYLKLEQLRLIAFYKRTQLIGLAIASSGLGLYIFEEISRDKTWLITGYSLFFVYILVCWFVVRPLAFRNKTKKLKVFITKLEEISQQFSNN